MKTLNQEVSTPASEILYVHSVLTLLREVADHDAPFSPVDGAARVLLDNAIYRMENLMEVTA